MKRIKGFDGLRAFSVLLVFYEHKVSQNGIGSLGVGIFFCLSGYLIVGILQRARLGLEQDDSAQARRRALLDFWRNRAVRIFPVYYTTLLLVFAAKRMPLPEFGFYAAYLQNFQIAFVTRTWGVVTHLWSLAVEQQFYVLAAPTLLWMTASKHRALMLVVFWCCLAFTLVSPLAGWDQLKVSLSPLSKFAFMAAGGYAALESQDSRVYRALAHPITLLASTLAVAAAYGLLWAINPDAEVLNTLVGAAGLLFGVSLICVVVQRQSGGLVWFLDLQPMRWLGQISYGFYVYHYLVPDREPVLRRLHWAAFSRITQLEWVFVQLAFTLLVSHLSWVYFERRFLALKSRKPSKPERRSALELGPLSERSPVSA